MSNFLKRLIVTIIGVPTAVFIIYQGGWLFATFIIILSSVTLWEFYNITKTKGANPFINTAIVSHILMLIVFFIPNHTEGFPNFSSMQGTVAVILVGVTFSLIVLSASIWQKKPNPILSVVSTLSGWAYISVPFLFLIFLREIKFHELDLISSASNSPHYNLSAGFVMTMVASVWICDTAAYLTGMAFGKHKLIPSVSPKKTWEGSIGGFVFAIISFVVGCYYLVPGLKPVHSIVCGIIVGTIGQIGDLAESKFKRDAGVKDSSELIPGHGGLFDRFDSLLFVIPSIAIYLVTYFWLSHLM